MKQHGYEVVGDGAVRVVKRVSREEAPHLRVVGGRAVAPKAAASVQRLQTVAGNAAVQRVMTAMTVQRDATSDLAQAVLADMSRQFRLWKGERWNRGAWWGATRPGETAGAKNVPAAVGRLIKDEAEKRGFHQAPSFSGGVSFHKRKPKGTIDFIYHMQAP